jgi:hypothetical protein
MLCGMVPASRRNARRTPRSGPRGGLILPVSAILHQEKPRYACTLCEFVAWRASDLEKHVLAHPMEDVLEHSPRHHAPGIFHPDAGDAEWSKWIRDHAAAGADPMVYMKTSDGKSGGGIGDG